MKTIINYIRECFRECFCEHYLMFAESNYSERDELGVTVRNGIKVSVSCPKCGYHKSYWKF